MGTSDGTVQGLTKILDNGPNDQRHNVVLVAEGFQDSEQSDFNDLCEQFRTTLEAEAWFAELGQAINLFRLNVASDESGADDPATCDDGSSGSGATPDTYFDATYCNSGIRRCLSGSETIVRDTLDAQLPEWHTAAVLVNSSQRGGCASGDVFWTAISSDWKLVVLHELGHSSFGLADEYNYWAGCSSGETDRDHAPSWEPSEVNVTTEAERNQVKWRFFIHPTTPVPTMVNPDCSECDDRDNILPDDTTVGLYEGAKYYHCGRFRPAYSCKMRNSSQDFCRVCIDGIADALREFLDTDPTVEVIPTLLEFGDVAHGLTMYRSFEIRNVKVGAPVSVEIDLGAIAGDAGFSYPPDTETTFRIPAPVFESHLSWTVYVAFTSIDDGTPDAFGSLVVDTPGTAIDLPRTVNLSAMAVEPPPVDSVLVMDRSDSMDGATGVPGQMKIDLAIDAAQLYVSLLKDNDRIGVVRYNDLARDPQDILLGMREANATGKSLANSALTLTNLTPDGMTSIGGGIILGSSVLEDGTADSRALVVLTDGIQNTDPDIPEATTEVQTKSPEQRVFAVGLGLNQLEDRLDQIASVTNGTAQITGDLVDQKEFLLQKLYVQILSDVSDEAFVKDPKQMALPGEKQSTSVYIGEVDVSADFIVVVRQSRLFPKYMTVWLEAPDGTVIQPSDVGSLPNVTLEQGQSHLYYRWQFPAFPGRPEAHIGRWQVWVRNNSGRPNSTIAHRDDVYHRGEPLYYTVMSKARSDFRLDGRVEQPSHGPGSPMNIVLRPTLYGLPVALNEPVTVEVTRPDSVQRTLTLTRTSDGLYQAPFGETALVGIYRVLADVTATTPKGHHITRTRTMTGTIFVPVVTGGGGGRGDGDDRLVEVLKACCEEVGQRLDEILRQKRDC
ncbi:MAG: M64 family metallopeptidase [Candidatus Promineifilaceae bacterium]|nr:M64 family metallopeptidase [Candidatus Promineifilaceae bacterium]